MVVFFVSTQITYLIEIYQSCKKEMTVKLTQISEDCQETGQLGRECYLKSDPSF